MIKTIFSLGPSRWTIFVCIFMLDGSRAQAFDWRRAFSSFLRSPKVVNTRSKPFRCQDLLSRATLESPVRFTIQTVVDGKPRFHDIDVSAIDGSDTSVQILKIEMNSRVAARSRMAADFETFSEVFESFIAYVQDNYNERRGPDTPHHWSRKFLNKLKADFEAGFRDGALILFIAVDKKSREIQGSLRHVRPTYDSQGVVTFPLSSFLDVDIKIPASPYIGAHWFDPLVASYDSVMEGSPGIPPELIGRGFTPIKDHLFIDVFEPSSFNVSNNLPRKKQSAIKADLWLSYLTMITARSWNLYDSTFGKHFVTYADPASLNLYSPLGWVPLAEAAEKYHIRNLKSPTGKFPLLPIEKDGIKWVPIYTNPFLQSRDLDESIFGQRNRVGGRAMREGLLALEKAHCHRGYNINAELVTNQEIEKGLHIEFPLALVYQVQAITNRHVNDAVDVKVRWEALSRQLEFIITLIDTLKKLPSDSDLDAMFSESRAESMQVFRVQAQEMFDYYLHRREYLRTTLLDHLKQVFSSDNLNLKTETIGGLTSVLAYERWFPGHLDHLNLFDALEMRDLVAHIQARETDLELLRRLSVLRHYTDMRK